MKALLIFILAIISCTGLNLNEAKAIQSPSWGESSPYVVRSEVVNSVPDIICPSSYRYQAVAGESEMQKVCITDGSISSFGLYYGNYSYSPLVSFVNDSKMYKMPGVCDKFDSCLYLPETDTLVKKQYLINGFVRSLVVYKNFRSRLSVQFNAVSLANEYIFDSTNPDYILKSTYDYAWPIGGIAASSNGKWLAVEFRQRGVGLLNIDTLQMRRISNASQLYGAGMDPSTELAVNDSGTAVVMMGYNSGLTLIEIDNDCGDDANDTVMQNVSPLTNPCAISPIDVSKFIDRFRFATHPIFTDDGWGLDFFANSYSGEFREVSLRAGGSVVERVEYLALGDSFTSGEGEFSDLYYLPGTNEKFEKCHVSSRSYPFLLAKLSGIDMNLTKSVACSGARTFDLVGISDKYYGQNNRLTLGYLSLPDNELALARSEARINYIPGRILQSNFVQNSKPKVVTIGIGGNDVGIVDKLKSCLGPGTCSWASDTNKRRQFGEEIKSLQTTLEKTYQKIHDLSPSSKIFAVNYPRPTDINGTCDVITSTLLSRDERILLTEAVLYINKIIKAAASNIGIGYLDIQESYGDQAMCGSGLPTAINGLVAGDDIGLSWLRLIGSESFHPNPIGHELAANFVYLNDGYLASNDYCLDGLFICPRHVSTPELPEYWGQAEDLNILKSFEIVNQSILSGNKVKLSVNLPDYSMKPNSQINIRLNSETVDLGDFVINDLGGLNINIELSKSIEEGYHTLTVYGSSFSGEKVDLYQIIKYQKHEKTNNGKAHENQIEKADQLGYFINPTETKDSSLKLNKVLSFENLDNSSTEDLVNDKTEPTNLSNGSFLIKPLEKMDKVDNSKKAAVLGENDVNFYKEEVDYFLLLAVALAIIAISTTISLAATRRSIK